MLLITGKSPPPSGIVHTIELKTIPEPSQYSVRLAICGKKAGTHSTGGLGGSLAFAATKTGVVALTRAVPQAEVSD